MEAPLIFTESFDSGIIKLVHKHMFKKRIFTCLFLLISTAVSFSEEPVDLDKLTSECIEASTQYRKIQKVVAYKVLHTVEYEGWSGNFRAFPLQDPIGMVIRYAGAKRDGYYWFRNNPQKKYAVNVKTDFNGNIEIIESTVNRNGNYRFRGVMKDGIIKGIWEKGNGKMAFAFYAQVIEGKSNR